MKKFLLLIFIQLIQKYFCANDDYKRVCIYPNWSILRPIKIAKLYPEQVDVSICTHLHYAYANINVKTLELMPSLKQDILNGTHGMPLYDRIMKLKKSNPKIKILISVGGFFAKSTSFNQVIFNEAKRKKFIQNVLLFLKKYNFDGLDIHWTYPDSETKTRFTVLLQVLILKINNLNYNLNIIIIIIIIRVLTMHSKKIRKNIYYL
jgi:chitinase